MKEGDVIIPLSVTGIGLLDFVAIIPKAVREKKHFYDFYHYLRFSPILNDIHRFLSLIGVSILINILKRR